MGPKEPIGIMAPGSVHALEKRISKETIDRFGAIGDLTGTLSDVLDDLGIVGTISASVLKPTMPAKRIIGTALTLRHDPVSKQPVLNAESHINEMAEIEAHNQAEAGDVLVIQGLPYISGMGGISATIGKRQGEIGAVVDGGIRDVAYQRSIDFPIWSASVSPITGKWRSATTEVNGAVRIHGIIVNAGDLVVADETGICFVPADLVDDVLQRCEAVVEKETAAHEQIAAGISVKEIGEMLRHDLHTTENA
jgi:4-hydroxy-4-methyl-2-oxoglutarate aldolase